MIDRLKWTLLLLVLAFPAAADPVPPPKHVVILLADTLRQDYVGAYGGEESRTSNIDALARNGVRFTSAYTVFPGSSPSYTSLFSSQFPFEHGVTNNAMPLPADLQYLPQSLHENGFRTAAFVSNYYCNERFGFDRGFDTFVGLDRVGKHAWTLARELLPWLEQWNPSEDRLFLFVAYMDLHTPYSLPHHPYWLQFRFGGKKVGKPRSPENRFEQAVRLTVPPGEHHLVLERIVHPLRPWWNPSYDVTPFPWSSLIKAGVTVEFTENVRVKNRDPNSGTTTWNTTAFPVTATITNPTGEPITGDLAIQVSRQYTPEEAQTIYPRSLEYLDHEIGRVVDVLRDKGVLDETLIVVLSDHGESLGEHDLRGHIEQLYEPLVKIPLIFRYPPLGKDVALEHPVSIIDIAPTLAELLGLDWDPGQAQTLVPSITDGTTLPRDWIFAETYPPEAGRRMVCLGDGKTKLIVNLTERQIEFYDLVADPGETKNLYTPSDPPEALAAYKERFGLSDPFEEPSAAGRLDLESLSPEEIERLRALGYIE